MSWWRDLHDKEPYYGQYANGGPAELDDKAKTDNRSCTCHPDDNPPVPCQRQFALTDCRQAIALTGPAKVFYELWQSAERELTGTVRERFEAIIASLNYDGQDTNSLTVGEIRRALPSS